MAQRVTQVGIEVFYQSNNSIARVTQAGLESLPREYIQEPQTNQHQTVTPPAAYPLPLNGGPQYSRFFKQADLFYATAQEFKTGNIHLKSDTEERVVRWLLQYDYLSETEALLLDNHWLSARGQFFGFDFTDPRSLLLYQNAHYAPDGWKAEKHNKRGFPRRAIVIEWRSATGSILTSSSSSTFDADTWDSSLFGA